MPIAYGQVAGIKHDAKQPEYEPDKRSYRRCPMCGVRYPKSKFEDGSELCPNCLYIETRDVMRRNRETLEKSNGGTVFELRCSNGKTYESEREAASDLGVSRYTVKQHLIGKRRHIEGETIELVPKHGGEVVRSDGKVYSNAREAARDTGCSPSAVSKCLRGKMNRAKGYSFRWKDQK